MLFKNESKIQILMLKNIKKSNLYIVQKLIYSKLFFSYVIIKENMIVQLPFIFAFK